MRRRLPFIGAAAASVGCSPATGPLDDLRVEVALDRSQIVAPRDTPVAN